jgi:hypothetical protein
MRAGERVGEKKPLLSGLDSIIDFGFIMYEPIEPNVSEIFCTVEAA